MSALTHTVLLLDAGNSRLKWALAQDGAVLQQGVMDYAQLDGLAAVLAGHDIQAAFGCNVAGAAVADAVAMQLSPLVPQWLKPNSEQGGVRNGYRIPDQLGADRWAALIGARAQGVGDAIVVMAGTAMTVDALTAEGEFLGGVIVPGYQLMRQALAQGTANLGLPEGEPVDFPRSTGEAIINGALVALTGAIAQMQQRLAACTGRPVRVLLSGGDAPRLAPRLRADLAECLLPVDNLVLGGLMRLAFPPMPPGSDLQP